MITNSSLLQDAGGPAAAPPTIEPVLRLPLRLNVDGSMGNPTIDFGVPDATLHVIEHVNDGWLSVVIWHAPTAAAALLCVTPMLLLIVLVRTTRRRQQFGHYYCRKCNYDLTGPGGMPPEATGEAALLCPECGMDQRAKPARLGRSFGARVWVSTLCAILLLVVSVVTLLVTLERSNPSNTWKSAWMEPLSRTGLVPRLVNTLDMYESSAQHVSTWAIPKGSRTAELRVSSSYPYSAVTRESEWFAWAEVERRAGCVLRAANLRTGLESVPSLPTPGPHNIYLVIPSMKPGNVIVGYTNSIQRASNEAVLARLDLIKGTFEILAQVPLQASQLTTGGTFVFREQAASVQWAYIAYGSAATPGVLAGTVMTAQKQSFPFEQPGRWWVSPTMTPDGLSVDIASGGGVGTTTATRILLSDGSQTTVPYNGTGYPPAISANGRSVQWRRIATTGGQLQVQGSSGRLIGLLGTGSGTPNLPAISADGRWTAASVTIPRTTIAGSPALDAFVYVWDLEPLEPGK